MCRQRWTGAGKKYALYIYIFFHPRGNLYWTERPRQHFGRRPLRFSLQLDARVCNMTLYALSLSLSLSLSLYMHSSPMSPHLPLVVLLHADDPHPPPLWGNKKNNNFHGRNSIPFTPTPFFHALFQLLIIVFVAVVVSQSIDDVTLTAPLAAKMRVTRDCCCKLPISNSSTCLVKGDGRGWCVWFFL